MQEYLTHSEAETEQAGADFARTLPDGKVGEAYSQTLSAARQRQDRLRARDGARHGADVPCLEPHVHDRERI